MVPTVELLFLGNELLIGRVTNTNLTFLGKELTKNGFMITHSQTIQDDRHQIITVIREIISRGPDIIIISGGLGPTFDDIQLECLASAINRPLIENKKAMQMLRERYNNSRITPSRKKMACLPEGSIALHNSAGSAPGVFTKLGDIEIYSVPGVPSEMKAIFNEQILPRIETHSNVSGCELAFTVSGGRESKISPILDEVRKEYPDINFKTHPRVNQVNCHVYGYSTRDYAWAAISELHSILSQNYQCSEIQDLLA